jgi:hypothetical protein
MKRPSVGLLLCVAFLLVQCVDLFAQSGQGQSSQGQNAQGQEGQDGPTDAGIHWAKGQGPFRFGSLANMSWHGGPVMGSAVVQPIFWGPSWTTTNPAFADKMDASKGLPAFYLGMSFSSYANTTYEYYDSVNKHVGNSITVGASMVDLSPVTASGSQTGPILNEVCKEIATPVSNGYYPVYVDIKRGNAQYCAWHSVGTCNGTQVQFAFFFNLDGDAGCDPQDTSGQHSQGLAALANVSGHELSEARSDPALNAWYDFQGNENADKCAWSFGTPLLTFTNGTQWKVQGNWSNSHNNAGTGYPNLNGQRGCIDGGKYK